MTESTEKLLRLFCEGEGLKLSDERLREMAGEVSQPMDDVLGGSIHQWAAKELSREQRVRFKIFLGDIIAAIDADN